MKIASAHIVVLNHSSVRTCLIPPCYTFSLSCQRELAALRQHDGETMEQLVTARDKIRKLTGMIEEVKQKQFFVLQVEW